jgi:hypothetical protein
MQVSAMLFPVRTSKRNLPALSLSLVFGISSCSPKAPMSAVAIPPQADATATIQEIMAGKIDPAADALWGSVAFIESPSGTEDRRPRTEAEWRAVRTDAVSLLDATKLLRFPGRLVKYGNALPGHGELPTAEIQRRIDANHESFVQFVGLLQDAGFKALNAIDAKDAQGLMNAGGVIDEACEACHVTYWYPNQNRPGT